MTNMNDKLLSIIIPVYNQAHTICETLSSLHYIDKANRNLVELIIIDDGSKDDSAKIAEGLLRKSKYEFKILAQDNSGPSSARNLGLKNSKGKWVYFLDGDDKILTDPVSYLKYSEDATALFFSTSYRSGRKFIKTVKAVSFNSNNYLKKLSIENKIVTGSVIFKKDVIDNYFDEKYICLEDWHFWMNNMKLFDRPVSIDSVVLVEIQLHEGSASTDTTKMSHFREQVAIEMFEKTKHLGGLINRNFFVQRQIGLIAQGKKPEKSIDMFLPILWPICSPKLLLKLVYYYFNRKKYLKHDG